MYTVYYERKALKNLFEIEWFITNILGWERQGCPFQLLDTVLTSNLAQVSNCTLQVHTEISVTVLTILAVLAILSPDPAEVDICPAKFPSEISGW